jgi:L-ribulose-5-phosphate 4-epimerase
VDEGYIKYTINHLNGLEPLYFWTMKISRVRTGLFDLGLIGVTSEGIGYGNISTRLGCSAGFVISGAATGAKRELRPEDFSEVLSFDTKTNRVNCIGKIRSSSESMSHGAIYNADKGVKAVIHVHHQGMWEYMLTNPYPSTSERAAFGTPELAEEINSLVVQHAKPNGVFVLKGHQEGVIAYASQLESARDLLLGIYEKQNR